MSVGAVGSLPTSVDYEHINMRPCKIRSNQIKAKGDFVQMCVFTVSLSICVSDCLYYTYYVTALHTYGSEAVDQHNDDDGTKT